MTGPFGDRPAPAGDRSTLTASVRHLVERGAKGAQRRLEFTLGGRIRTRVIVLLACVLGLSSADTATVGASAIELRQGLGISNTDIGLLVAVSSLVAAVASVPFGILADRTRRTLVLGIAVSFWGMAMIWSATVSSFGELLLTRLVLGVLTAAAGPMVASLVGDYFHSAERGRIYGYVLAGELIGAGLGFAVTGDVAALSWRAAFVVLGLPAFVLAWFMFRLPEPARGTRAPLEPAPGEGHRRHGAGKDGAEGNPFPTIPRSRRPTPSAWSARKASCPTKISYFGATPGVWASSPPPATYSASGPTSSSSWPAVRLLLLGRGADVWCRVRTRAVQRRPGAGQLLHAYHRGGCAHRGPLQRSAQRQPVAIAGT